MTIMKIPDIIDNNGLYLMKNEEIITIPVCIKKKLITSFLGGFSSHFSSVIVRSTNLVQSFRKNDAALILVKISSRNLVPFLISKIKKFLRIISHCSSFSTSGSSSILIAIFSSVFSFLLKKDFFFICSFSRLN